MVIVSLCETTKQDTRVRLTLQLLLCAVATRARLLERTDMVLDGTSEQIMTYDRRDRRQQGRLFVDTDICCHRRLVWTRKAPERSERSGLNDYMIIGINCADGSFRYITGYDSMGLDLRSQNSDLVLEF